MSDMPELPTPPGAQDWWPLRVIGEKLGVSTSQMNRWAEDGRNNDFPKPKLTQGRHKFYDLVEVQTWLFFYRRAIANHTGTDNLRQNRGGR